ncbi:neutral/alkaline non-lysosomal ceramidase N-terminal domain-containing protein [Planctomyces sp. SH-PL62]|uniref:neutral/alkaline non-lysosomal ceramidase N-terminal domain-containing protein n=1 Tax=Planctomyces sp. SH-PL62 TaxID=1636152 RepID=UPI00078E73E0|nr:neutral/alkaline non-lysosomal ceramidase N-terminal domain-containing protein [Planctomyces sp. SH-PL62]AMV38407.1 Neutral/alkaline non-lysosomal ceramidase [Planctomyces sp. SH-PL62]
MRRLRRTVVVGLMMLVVEVPASRGFDDGGPPPSWKAGTATVAITPERPLVLLGYTDRKGPFEGVSDELSARALALEDARGRRAVVVAADLVGFQSAVVTDAVTRRIAERTGLGPERLIFNASHTHTGPVVSLDPNLTLNVAHPDMTPEQAEATAAYTRRLQDQLVDLVERALAALRPARLSWAAGRTNVPTSRRLPKPEGVVMAPNPDAPVDDAVPVLRVDSPEGKPLAVVFGCACHAVAAGTGNVISADYPGYARAVVEARHPGATALFLAGCGGDANPEPRGAIEQARTHGEALGREVCQVLDGPLAAVDGPLQVAYAQVDLPLQQLSRKQIEGYLDRPNFQAWQARHMLEVLDAGERLPTRYTAPVAVWRFGKSLTLAALPGEPVAEYATLLRKALGPDGLWVAGYNNDCFGYLPTARVVEEGGHEAIGVTLWAWSRNLSPMVGFFEPRVQDVVVDAVRRLADEARIETQVK